jgi:hypothetical protein
MADFSLLAVFGMDTTGIKTEMKSLRRDLNDFVSEYAKLGAGLAVGAFAMLSKGAMELAGSLSDASKNIGINVESLQALQAQHKRNGVSNEELTKALEKTKAAVINAAEGDAKAEAALEKLHLTSSKLMQLPLDKQYEAIARAVATSKDETAAYSAVSDLLGAKVGPKLMGSLKELGDVGLPGVTQSAKEAGHVMGTSTIAALDAAGDAIDDFKKKATIWAGEVIVNFRTTEGLQLVGMQLMSILGKFGGGILDAIVEAGGMIKAVFTGAFFGVSNYLQDSLVDVVQGVAGLINKILPARFEINVGNLDEFRSSGRGIGDSITEAIARTSPSTFKKDFGDAWDSAIAEQQKVVSALNAVDFKDGIEALDKVIKTPIKPPEIPKIPPIKVDEPSIAKAVQSMTQVFMGAIRGGSAFNTASDEALQAVVRFNTQKARDLNPFGVATTANYQERIEAGRLMAEAKNAQDQLKMRADLRYNYNAGGSEQVFRNMTNIDPIVLEGLIKQFAMTLPQTERTANALEQISNGLTNAGIITRY